MTTMQSHKRRGAGFEIDLLDYLRERGYRAERLAKAGRYDEGDISVYDPILDQYTIIECKAPGKDGKINLTGWRKEALTEAANFARARGIDPARVRAYVVIRAFRQPIENAHWISTIESEYGSK